MRYQILCAIVGCLNCKPVHFRTLPFHINLLYDGFYALSLRTSNLNFFFFNNASFNDSWKHLVSCNLSYLSFAE